MKVSIIGNNSDYVALVIIDNEELRLASQNIIRIENTEDARYLAEKLLRFIDIKEALDESKL